MAHKVAKNQPINNCEDTVDVYKNTSINMGHIFQPTNTHISTVNHTACEMRNNLLVSTDFSRQNLLNHKQIYQKCKGCEIKHQASTEGRKRYSSTHTELWRSKGGGWSTSGP
jgi:hypothetical protein